MVLYTEQYKRDVEDILDYSNNFFGEDATVVYLSKIRLEESNIQKFPDINPNVANFKNLKRKNVVKLNISIIYSLYGEELVFLKIFHTKRNIKKFV